MFSAERLCHQLKILLRIYTVSQKAHTFVSCYNFDTHEQGQFLAEMRMQPIKRCFIYPSYPTNASALAKLMTMTKRVKILQKSDNECLIHTTQSRVIANTFKLMQMIMFATKHTITE